MRPAVLAVPGLVHERRRVVDDPARDDHGRHPGRRQHPPHGPQRHPPVQARGDEQGAREEGVVGPARGRGQPDDDRNDRVPVADREPPRPVGPERVERQPAPADIEHHHHGERHHVVRRQEVVRLPAQVVVRLEGVQHGRGHRRRPRQAVPAADGEGRDGRERVSEQVEQVEHDDRRREDPSEAPDDGEVQVIDDGEVVQFLDAGGTEPGRPPVVPALDDFLDERQDQQRVVLVGERRVEVRLVEPQADDEDQRRDEDRGEVPRRLADGPVRYARRGDGTGDGHGRGAVGYRETLHTPGYERPRE